MVHAGAMLGRWAYVGPILGLCWAYVGSWGLCWELMSGQERRVLLGLVSRTKMPGPCWVYVGPILGQCWAYVGSWGLCWELMLGQERRVLLGLASRTKRTRCFGPCRGHVGPMWDLCWSCEPLYMPAVPLLIQLIQHHPAISLPSACRFKLTWLWTL